MTSLRRPIATATRTPEPSHDNDWRAKAACSRQDADAWFAEGAYRNYEDAREVCVRDCAVRAECLQMALNDPLLTYGMYGGLTPDERRRIRRRTREGRA